MLLCYENEEIAGMLSVVADGTCCLLSLCLCCAFLICCFLSPALSLQCLLPFPGRLHPPSVTCAHLWFVSVAFLASAF